MNSVTLTCSVCGMGGYWVAYDPTTDSIRCVKHIGSTPASLRLAAMRDATTERNE